MDDRPSSAARTWTEPGLSAGLHFPDPLGLLHRQAVHTIVAGIPAVPTDVFERHARVDQWIDARIEVKVLLAFPRPREPVDDSEAVGAHDDAPPRILVDSRTNTQQRLAHRFQFLTIIGGFEVTADAFVDLPVGPFQPVRPGTRAGVSRARTVCVCDHRRGHGARMRSQLAHWVRPAPVRTARRSSMDTGMRQPPQNSPGRWVTAGRRRAAIRAYSARSAASASARSASRSVLASLTCAVSDSRRARSGSIEPARLSSRAAAVAHAVC